MARFVTNLSIYQQEGSDNTFVATWKFQGDQAIDNSGWLHQWVRLKPGATYYNGTAIPSAYFDWSWPVLTLDGDKAGLGTNRDGNQDFGGYVSTSYLEMAFGISPDLIETTDHFTVHWVYDVGDGVWYDGSSTDTAWTSTVMVQNTYSPPTGTVAIRVTVTPVAKTYKVQQGDTEVDTPYWNGEGRSTSYYFERKRPETPPVPTVTVDGYKLTASVENISDPQTDQIQFALFDDNEKINSATVKVVARRATWTTDITPGGNYRVLCRAMNVRSDGYGAVYSDWTDLSDAVKSPPATPSGITTIRGASSTSVYLEWGAVSSADTYDIEYTTNVTYFGGGETTTVSTEGTYYTVTGLESGDEYFFRVRAVNDQGESGWTSIKSVIIGKPPAAPTTWSNASTIIVGRELNLYWVHNSADNSKEYYAQVEIYLNNSDTPETHTIKNPNTGDEDEDDTAHVYTVDTSIYKEGTTLKWRVRTAGITQEWGDWSVMRVVNIYAPPTLSLTLKDSSGAEVETLSSFPLVINGFAGPNTQNPISYHITVTSRTDYDYVDQMGRSKVVHVGDVIFSKNIDTSDPLTYELTAGNIDFQSGAMYTVEVVVSMNSGLTATSTADFDVIWTDEQYNVDISIALERDAYVAYITPYCTSMDDTTTLATGVTLSVYRREFDDTLTEIATGLPNTRVTVTDPHPPLDYVRYRVVAIDDATGAVSYYDPPAYPVAVGEGEIVIQWDESWPNYIQPIYQKGMEPDEQPYFIAGPMWNGTLLKLPYNIDTTEQNTPDVSLVAYAGRRNPVSYYGTQIETKATWNVEIPAYDRDTLYLIRRLSMYQGDVYVREPSGMGYWANVTVSFNITHRELTIPITFTITKVEGGV